MEKMIYKINNDEKMEKIKRVLSEKGRYCGRFKDENGSVEVYNCTPSTFLLRDGFIEIIAKLPVGVGHSKLQLENQIGFELK